MAITTRRTKTNRNLRALFVLAAIICLFAIGSGALILTLGYSRPEVAQPLWRFGQYVLFVGLINSAIYCGIYFQMRSIRREANAQTEEAQQVGDGDAEEAV